MSFRDTKVAFELEMWTLHSYILLCSIRNDFLGNDILHSMIITLVFSNKITYGRLWHCQHACDNLSNDTIFRIYVTVIYVCRKTAAEWEGRRRERT